MSLLESEFGVLTWRFSGRLFTNESSLSCICCLAKLASFLMLFHSWRCESDQSCIQELSFPDKPSFSDTGKENTNDKNRNNKTIDFILEVEPSKSSKLILLYSGLSNFWRLWTFMTNFLYQVIFRIIDGDLMIHG